MENKASKIVFADQLRAVAVFLVIIVHWCGVYWVSRDLVGTYIYAPPVSGEMSPLLGWLMPPTFNFGPLGVSIFFLISGFVIPFSLQRATPVEFLLSRTFRIYPTYIVGSAVMLLIVWLSATYWGAYFSIDLDRLIANLFLVHADMRYPTIDLVNWTLAIEIKFYIVCAIMYRCIRSANIVPIIAFSVAVLIFCELYPSEMDVIRLVGNVGISMEALKPQLICVVFMFIGTCFYYFHLGKINARELMLSIAILFGIVLLGFPHTEWKLQIPDTPRNYIYGLILFSACFYFRARFRPIPGLSFIAKISYPIYIVHSLLGYAFMRVLADVGVPFELAIIAAFALVLAIASGLHVAIERPTMHLGKRLHAMASNRTAQAVSG